MRRSRSNDWIYELRDDSNEKVVYRVQESENDNYGLSYWSHLAPSTLLSK